MKKIIARLEALFKGVAFDCHACGQCVLSQTGSPLEAKLKSGDFVRTCETKTTFVSEIIHNLTNSVENVLCLTGDSYATLPIGGHKLECKHE